MNNENLQNYFDNFVSVYTGSLNKEVLNTIKKIANKTYTTLKQGNKIMFAGNGGSASDCQHFAAEYVSKIKNVRKPLNAISLTSDISIITSIANDFGFEHIFERQIEAIGKKKDIIFLYSTSGISKNILSALKVCKKLNILTVGFTGKNKKNYFSKNCDYIVNINSSETSHIQEIYKIISHYICFCVERNF